MKIAAIVAARMGSTRFPGKVLADLAGQPVLEHVLQRVKASRVDDVIVAIPGVGHILHADDRSAELWRWLSDHGYKTWWDELIDEDNVLERLAGAADDHDAGVILRVNSDCPFVRPEEIDRLIDVYSQTKCDYAAYMHADGTPAVLTPVGCPELITQKALNEAHEYAARCMEHVTTSCYVTHSVHRIFLELSAERRQEDNTVDVPQDLERLTEQCRLQSAAVK